MDTSKLPKSSDNFEDRTDDSDAQKLLTAILVKINPVYAVRHARDELISRGYIEPKVTSPFRKEK